LRIASMLLSILYVAINDCDILSRHVRNIQFGRTQNWLRALTALCHGLSPSLHISPKIALQKIVVVDPRKRPHYSPGNK
jgi:hypothetical protein